MATHKQMSKSEKLASQLGYFPITEFGEPKERLVQQQDQIEQSCALQSLLRNVTFAKEGKTQSLCACDSMPLIETLIAVSNQ
eukprot:12557314-Ditylum_brightwellii.AAC.1